MKRNIFDLKETLEKEFQFIAEDTESDNLSPSPDLFFDFDFHN
jgi:hypothetical protein